MKKLLFLFCLVGLLVSCDTTQNQEMLDEFSSQKLSSFHQYLESNNLIHSNVGEYEIDFKEARVEEIDGIEVMNIRLEDKEGNLLGFVFGVKIPEANQHLLAQNSEYAIIFEDFREYEILTKAGKLSTYDWNTNKKVDDIWLKDSKVIAYEKIDTKSNSFGPSNDIPDSCYGGEDEDVSWGECVSCLRSICFSDPDCANSLVFSDVGGAYVGTPGIGTLAIGTACIYIAATN
ncbi:MAG: hypothetical protein AAFY71_08655 [Bacteroidota bacterium]